MRHMFTIIVALTGIIGSGKSSAAEALARGENRALHLRTSDLLRQTVTRTTESLAGLTREELRTAGNNLDKECPSWLSDEIDEQLSDARAAGEFGSVVVLDCARSFDQLNNLRNGFGAAMLHVHLHCDAAVAMKRAETRRREGDEGVALHLAMLSDTQNAFAFERAADVVINTERMTARDVATIIEAHIDRMHGNTATDRCVDVLVGGQYGSEGKGFVMQHIVSPYDVLCRVGGPNAGHSVLNPSDGRKVSFYHLPSGVLHAPNADILIGPGAVVNPEILRKEITLAESLGVPVWNRILIDEHAMVIENHHIDAESKLVAGIGSTGQGVGAATSDKVLRRGILARESNAFEGRVGDTREYLERKMSRGARVMMEGTQGTGLSLHHGHYPYVTSRDTTVSGTLGEMGIPARRVNRVVMVCRTNPIRVQSPNGGTSGPMGVELAWEEISKRSGIPADELRITEKTTTTKRLRRIAEFDYAQLRRASVLNAPTDIAVTFVDYIDIANRGASRYDQLTADTHAFIAHVEAVARAPVTMVSTGFSRGAFIDRRRAW